MTTYHATVTVPPRTAALIDHYLDNPGEDGWQDFDNVITYTAEFSNGFIADVKCYGIGRWEEGGDNSSWTEMVLFEPEHLPDGHVEYYEVTHTEPEDTYFGTWEAWYEAPDGNTDYYVVDVVRG